MELNSSFSSSSSSFSSSSSSSRFRPRLRLPLPLLRRPIAGADPRLPPAAQISLPASSATTLSARRDSALFSGRGSSYLSATESILMRSKVPPFRLIRASDRQEAEPTNGGGGGVGRGQVVGAGVVTIFLAVLNRVLSKLALVPLKQYPFFLAQLITFGYVVVYFFILYLRYRAGIVTKEMLALPKSPFVLIGILEALGVASSMSAGAMLPGPAIPLLSQSFLVWQLILSVLILKRKYSINQILGCLLVTFGLILAVASGANEGEFLSQVDFIWPTLMIVSSAFLSGASILKEFIFIDGAKRLQGKRPDIFVLNSFGSGFQALFVFILLPFLSKLRGIPFVQLPSYIRSGAACFLNVGGNISGCEGAPLLPLLFITINMAFNISLLNLVKISSAVVSTLASTLAVPTSIYILSLPLPYVPEGTNLSGYFAIGTGILVLGLLLFNLPQSSSRQSEKID